MITKLYYTMTIYLKEYEKWHKTFKTKYQRFKITGTCSNCSLYRIMGYCEKKLLLYRKRNITYLNVKILYCKWHGLSPDN